MPSLRSRLFVFALQHRHLLRPKGKRTTFIDWNTSIDRLREETEKPTGLFGRLPADITVLPEEIGGTPAEWLVPSGWKRDAAMIYLHGGGYVIGSSRSCRPIVAKLVQRTGIAALVPDYRLAPEHPFPAALDDAVAAYGRVLAAGIPSSRIVVTGDSGGGGLALALLLALKERNMPLPAAATVNSPWTDLKNTGESLVSNAKRDTLCWPGSNTVFSAYYAGDHDPGLPLISPLYGDLGGLPPLMIHVGGDELLRDDSTRFARRAAEAGVDVAIHVGEGLFHCYPVCAPLFPEATEAMERICGFIAHHASPASERAASRAA